MVILLGRPKSLLIGWYRDDINPPIAARRAQWVVSRRQHTFSHISIIKSEQVRDTRVIDLIILKEISSIFPSRQSFWVCLTYRFLGCPVYACRAHVALALSSRKGVPHYNRRFCSQRLCLISRNGLKNSYGNSRSSFCGTARPVPKTRGSKWTRRSFTLLNKPAVSG